MRRASWVGVKLGALLVLALAAGLLAACSGDAQHAARAGGGTNGAGGSSAGGGNHSTAGSGGVAGGISGAPSSTNWGPRPDPMLGAEPTWPALTLEQFRAQFAAARCKQLAGCCSSFDQTACAAHAYADWYAANPVVEGTFDAAVGAACLALVQSATCADHEYYPYCKDIFVPHVARGAACEQFDKCEPSPVGEVLCLNDMCTLLWRRDEGQSCDGDCKIETGGFNYDCGYRTDGGPLLQVPFCDRNQNLSCDHWKCRSIPGELCYDGKFCAADEFCQDKAAGCVRKPRVGEVCDFYCFESLCSADKRCVPLYGLGEHCYASGACQSGYCQTDDTCAEPGAEYCALGK